MSLVKIFKEVKEINHTSVFEDQVNIVFDEKTPLDLLIELKPKYGFFQGTKIDFSLKIPEDYPNSKPKVLCKNVIFHPNISDGNICFSMFDSDWNNSYRIEHYINGLLWLLSNPNHESPLFSTAVEKNLSEYKKLVNFSTKGFQIRNVQFNKISKIDNPLENDVLDFIMKNNLKPTIDDFEKLTKEFLSKEFKFEKILYSKRKKTSFMYNTALQLPVPLENILKVVVFLNSKSFPIILVTNGYEIVSIEWLKSYLKDEKIRLATSNELQTILGVKPQCIPICCIKPESALILLNKRIEKLDYVYIESGIENAIFEVSSKNLFKNENFKVEEFKTIFQPLYSKKYIFKKMDSNIFFNFQ